MRYHDVVCGQMATKDLHITLRWCQALVFWGCIRMCGCMAPKDLDLSLSTCVCGPKSCADHSKPEVLDITLVRIDPGPIQGPRIPPLKK